MAAKTKRPTKEQAEAAAGMEPPASEPGAGAGAQEGKSGPQQPQRQPRITTRDGRQAAVAAWVRDTFGEALLNVQERVARVLEEAIELAQAEGFPMAQAVALVKHVYSKPAGLPHQEVGGIGVTLLAYCAVRGLSAETEEKIEAARVRVVGREHFRQRQNAKAAAGVADPCA